MKICEALNLAREKIDYLDAEVLLSHALICERVYLKTWPEENVPTDKLEKFQKLINKRSIGVPIAYILGSKEFWDLKLSVSSEVLIPRPETEILVEQALNKLINKNQSKILELGTGSGAIALVLAKNFKDAEIIAIDNSQAALDIAFENSQKLNIKNINFVYSDWFENIDKNNKFDLIISNPPYVAEKDPHLLGDIRFEPLQALVAGDDGLKYFRLIIKQARSFLRPQGWLMLEHGFNQENILQELFIQSGFNQIQTYKDLSGISRVIIGVN
jgi:release factor glutamine methyltransferase